MPPAEEILITKSVFALVGASQNGSKYGYEVLSALLKAGYMVCPVNPRYLRINGSTRYGSLSDMPQKTQVVITALPPQHTEKTVEQAAALGVEPFFKVSGFVWRLSSPIDPDLTGEAAVRQLERRSWHGQRLTGPGIVPCTGGRGQWNVLDEIGHLAQTPI